MKQCGDLYQSYFNKKKNLSTTVERKPGSPKKVRHICEHEYELLKERVAEH